ncbi:MAG: hypothetical protein LBT33_07080 [Spirochaetia bacterium]|jgi:hypothetical protein|nr:hypothetical protein [Spirochaetia bacterium]
MRNKKLRQGAFFFGPAEKKPGYPLQSFLPQAAKKDFRYYPSRGPGEKASPHPFRSGIPARPLRPHWRNLWPISTFSTVSKTSFCLQMFFYPHSIVLQSHPQYFRPYQNRYQYGDPGNNRQLLDMNIQSQNHICLHILWKNLSELNRPH